MINIKIDSRKVKKDDIFVAIKGATVDGHDFINDAIKNGATKVIAEHGSYDVETVITDNPEEYITNYLVSEYKSVLEKIKFVGVTGTNGKTTTCYLTYQMLNKLGVKTAYIGTIGFYLDKFVKELPNTTPNVVDLYDLILEAYENGFDTIVMEVSSHAFDLKRVAGINFFVGGFTNLTQDHLDYHKSFENYLEAKKLIVDKTNTMVVNVDDEKGLEFCTKKAIKFGFNKESDLLIKSYKNVLGGTKIYFDYLGESYEVDTLLKGRFNVYNYIQAMIIASNFVDFKVLVKNSKAVVPPKGRCEIIPVKTGEAVVDYAHTPDAVKKIIDAFSEEKAGKIITVVGCGGDRDPIKRPIMGKIASDNSDYVVFTSDNPRTEKPELIMEDIIKGVDKDNFEIVLDRKSAIIRALDLIEKEDSVLILGKGHEDYQIIGHTKIHLDDAEQVELYNKNL